MIDMEPGEHVVSGTFGSQQTKHGQGRRATSRWSSSPTAAPRIHRRLVGRLLHRRRHTPAERTSGLGCTHSVRASDRRWRWRLGCRGLSRNCVRSSANNAATDARARGGKPDRAPVNRLKLRADRERKTTTIHERRSAPCRTSRAVAFLAGRAVFFLWPKSRTEHARACRWDARLCRDDFQEAFDRIR